MNISIPNTPIYTHLLPFLPEEGEYSPETSTYTVHHRMYSISDWVQKHTIHKCIMLYEQVLSTCATMAQAVPLAPVFSPTDIWVLDTGSVLWVPQKFTASSSPQNPQPSKPSKPTWMYALSVYLQETLLTSRKNQVRATSIRDFLGSIPLTYTLERMTYNPPYAVVV